MLPSLSPLQSPANIQSFESFNQFPQTNEVGHASRLDHLSTSSSSGSSRQLYNLPSDVRFQNHYQPQQSSYFPSSSHPDYFETSRMPHTPSYHINIEGLRSENLALTKKIIALEAKLDAATENYDKLLEKINASKVEGNCLVSKHVLPPPLCQEDYESVKFWTEKSYDEYQKRNDGDTDGLATKKPRRGRPAKSDENGDKHPFLEDNTGTSVDQSRLNKFSEKARKIFNSLKAASFAAPSWGRLGVDASDYIKIEMASEFEEFRFCEGFWKLERWASRAYGSWMQGVRRNDNDSENRVPKKRKRSMSLKLTPLLDDTGLLKMDSLDDVDAIAFPIDQPPTLPQPVVHTSVLTVPVVLQVPNKAPSQDDDPSEAAAPELFDLFDDGIISAQLDQIPRLPPQTEPIPPLFNPIAVVPDRPSTIPTLPPPNSSLDLVASAAAESAPNAPRPLLPIQNTPTSTPHPSKKAKIAPAAVVGTGLTEKNFAMMTWLKSNYGGSKADFEAHYKTLSPVDKKLFEGQAKAAKKSAKFDKLNKSKDNDFKYVTRGYWPSDWTPHAGDITWGTCHQAGPASVHRDMGSIAFGGLKASRRR